MESIPKIIHYVWVGGKPLTPLAQRCINSWHKYAPGYLIKRWDETNSPMTHPYVQTMYTQKKWAFVSDYIRFAVLAREGGVYLDTDQELLKPLDTFLDQVGFVGQSRSGQIESSIIGAVPDAPFIKKALQFYDTDTTYSTSNTSPLILESAIMAAGKHQVRVYEATYFHPIAEGEYVTDHIRATAYGIHHWAESWVPYARLRKILRRLGILPLLKYLRHYMTRLPLK
jgi:mannosyltransferase OCH1-like enzyme